MPRDSAITSSQPSILNDLPAPTITAALDGGLGYDDVGRDPTGSVVVSVGPYFQMEQGDLIEVFLGDPKDPTNRVGFKSAEDGDTGVVLVYVSNANIRKFGDGVHAFNYTIYTSIGLETIYSLPTDVRVKLSVPGGPDPHPHTPFLNENLALPFVIPDPVPENAQSATVHVQPWDDISEGDVLTVSWAGFQVSLPLCYLGN